MSSLLKTICLLLLVAVYGMLIGTLFLIFGDWVLAGLVCGAFWIVGGIYALLYLRDRDWPFVRKAALWGLAFYVCEMVLLGYLGFI